MQTEIWLSGCRRKSCGGGMDYLRHMRRYNNLNREVCKYAKEVKDGTTLTSLPTKQFMTGSKYTGQWNICGINGHGTYEFKNGVVYVGGFKNGLFDGKGEYRYENGERLIVENKNGIAFFRRYIFSDGIQYYDYDDQKESIEGLKLCRDPDRRFAVEINEGMKPAPLERMTAKDDVHELDDGHYDSGYGYYCKYKKMLYRYKDNQILRSLSVHEGTWIENNYRTAPLVEPIGPASQLYPEWLCLLDYEIPKPEKKANLVWIADTGDSRDATRKEKEKDKLKPKCLKKDKRHCKRCLSCYRKKLKDVAKKQSSKEQCKFML